MDGNEQYRENTDNTEITEVVELEDEPNEQKIPGIELADWAQSIAFAVIPVVLIFAFFARIIGVVGASMQPTLYENDRVLISDVLYTPKAGDVVVISKRSDMFPDPIIKRVIATEGQTICFNFATGDVWVDDVLLEENYIAERTGLPEDLVSGVTYEVPENCVFVMGDNRNHSSDSRTSEIGMVDERYILGRVLIQVYPLRKIGRISRT